VEEPSGDSALAAPAFGYVEFGVAHGLSREDLMKAAGLADALRADPDARCSPFAYVVLWRELITRLPSVVIPVELVRAMQPAALGVTAQVVLRADHIQHAGTLIERFLQLSDTAMTMTWHERGELAGWSIGHRPDVVAMRFPIELMIGVGFRLMSLAAGDAIPVTEVTFAHAAGYPVAAYEALFGAPVRFEQAQSALWFPKSALLTPFAGRDPIARYYLEARAMQLLAALPTRAASRSPIVEDVRGAILDELASSGADLARVAKRLALSTRTLQRRLEEVNTSYQELVDDVRSSAARTMLRDRSRAIVDVAFELGYADLKGFYRAFKRWTGQTPAEWRVSATP
jgi:AraC-like DNA-binding protein